MNTIQPATTANTIRITVVNSVGQARRVDEAIARRAYEIFERRGGPGWHELEDWRTAESEIRSKLFIGLTSSEDSLLVSCNIGRFEEDSVEIWVAPRQITICGKRFATRSNCQPHIPIAVSSFELWRCRWRSNHAESSQRPSRTSSSSTCLVHTEQRERIPARAA